MWMEVVGDVGGVFVGGYWGYGAERWPFLATPDSLFLNIYYVLAPSLGGG